MTNTGGRKEQNRWRAVRRAAVVGLAGIGAVSVITALWLLTRWPLWVDAWLDVSGPPEKAAAIVCLGAGTTTGRLPTEEGWRRIYTASQLFLDGYAPLIIFSGRGSEPVSEAEMYSAAAAWLAAPRDAMLLDAGAASTAEHPDTVLKVAAGRIRPDSVLLLVTSAAHSRRALLTFRKRGFTKIRVVSSWQARSTRGHVPGHASTSQVPAFVPDHKSYDDPLFRLQSRSHDLLVALREWVAIGCYWWRGVV